MSRLVLAVAAVVAVSAGCSHGTKQVKPKPTACERAQATALDEPRRNVLRGDVDGDGHADAVALVRVRAAPDRCSAFLIVQTPRQTLTQPLRGNLVPEVPRLNGLASITPGRLHIVVTTWQGASTEFAGLFAVRGDTIASVRTKSADNRLPYEGSVTHIDAVDCAQGGLVVASGWFYRGTSSFGFFRHFYRVGVDGFELARSQTGTSRSAVPVRRFREFREPQPFPSCMRVRAD